MGAARLDPGGVVVSCAACGRANRVPYSALDKTTRCGNCRAAIAAPDVPIAVTDSTTFDAAANTSTVPLIVDFWAPWCGPCRMVAPELDTVARRNGGRFLVLKVNTDEVTDIAERFRIRSIPTLAIVFGGRELDRFAGARPAAEIEAFASQVLAASGRRAS